MAKQKKFELPEKQDDAVPVEVINGPVEPLTDEKVAEYEESATALAYEARDAALRKLAQMAGKAYDPYMLGNIISVSQVVINRPKIQGGTASVGFFENLNQQLKIKTETKTVEITYTPIPQTHEKEIKPERNSRKPAKRAGTSRKHGGSDKRKTR